MFTSIRPTEILYFFQEPQLFVVQLDGRFVICLKVDEHDGENLYLICPTSKAIIEGMKVGKISLLAAFNQPWCWIVHTGADFSVLRSEQTSPDQVPSEYFPEPGVGLSPAHGIIKDSLFMERQQHPFMSVKFEGAALREGEIGFAT